MLICSIMLQNANVLQAALHLVRELDADSLQDLQDAISNRLELLSWMRSFQH